MRMHVGDAVVSVSLISSLPDYALICIRDESGAEVRVELTLGAIAEAFMGRRVSGVARWFRYERLKGGSDDRGTSNQSS